MTHDEDGFSHHCPKCNHHNPTMCVVTGQVKGLKAVAQVQRERIAELEKVLDELRYQAVTSCPPRDSPMQDAIDDARAVLKVNGKCDETCAQYAGELYACDRHCGR